MRDGIVNGRIYERKPAVIRRMAGRSVPVEGSPSKRPRLVQIFGGDDSTSQPSSPRINFMNPRTPGCSLMWPETQEESQQSQPVGVGGAGSASGAAHEEEDDDEWAGFFGEETPSAGVGGQECPSLEYNSAEEAAAEEAAAEEEEDGAVENDEEAAAQQVIAVQDTESEDEAENNEEGGASEEENGAAAGASAAGDFPQTQPYVGPDGDAEAGAGDAADGASGGVAASASVEPPAVLNECAACGKTVFGNQRRGRDKHGYYFHAGCAPKGKKPSICQTCKRPKTYAQKHGTSASQNCPAFAECCTCGN